MSIRSRLAKLQRSSSVFKPGNYDEAMANLLGATDALFWPMSFEMNKVNVRAPLQRLQKQYHEAGVEWSGLASGRNTAAWKSNQRLREAMADKGLVTLTKTNGIPLVKIVDVDGFRRRLGLYTTRCPAVLKVLIRAVLGPLVELDEPRAPRKSGLCSETWLSGGSYAEWSRRDDWVPFGEVVLPLLTAGTLESTQTTLGHILYRAAESSQEDGESTSEGSNAHFIQEMAALAKSSDKRSDKRLIKVIEELAEASNDPPTPELPVEIYNAYIKAFNEQKAKVSYFDPGHEIWIPEPATSY